MYPPHAMPHGDPDLFEEQNFEQGMQHAFLLVIRLMQGADNHDALIQLCQDVHWQARYGFENRLSERPTPAPAYCEEDQKVMIWAIATARDTGLINPYLAERLIKPDRTHASKGVQ